MKCKVCNKDVYGRQIAKGTGMCKECNETMIALPVAGYIEEEEEVIDNSVTMPETKMGWFKRWRKH